MTDQALRPVTVREDRTGDRSRHGPVAQLLIAWSPLSLILLAYALAQWVSAPFGSGGDGAAANRLGFGLHVLGPPALDRALFDVVPTVWLQRQLAGGGPHWWDAVAALVYVTHFVSIPILTAVMWFRLRDRFRSWLAAVLAFTVVGVSGYVVYPAAPPWLASESGAIGAVDRISSRGWDYLHLDLFAWLSVSGQGGSNPVAAMPSLHAGTAMLVALVLWPVAGRAARVALAGYVLLMALALVYTGEHYVADVLAGWLTAGIAAAAGAAVRWPGRRPGRPPCRRTGRRPDRAGRAGQPVRVIGNDTVEAGAGPHPAWDRGRRL